MNELNEGRILLVGEGNFSLSASLVEVGTSSGPQMIATCRDTFTAVQENHQLAASNIDFLEKAGATVLFEVDATDLHNHTDINFYHFERVIFNFPLADRHNIKKNRELLSDFFSSVKNILDLEKGQVMVTLCKGQGGTPADQPVRSWHDSWQVVSMAANAGFILTHIYPFEAEKFERYKSVGFRFQDKGFSTENALTHVFEVAPTVSGATVGCGRFVLSEDGRQFVVPAYVHRKHDRWSLLNKEGHPVHTLLTHLASHLSLTFPSLLHLPPNTSPLLPKVLPGYVSSLSAVPWDGEDDVGSTVEAEDNGQVDHSVWTLGGVGNGLQREVSVTIPQTDATWDSGQQGPSSKERKEQENRQKMAARCPPHTATAGTDGGATGGNDTVAADRNCSADHGADSSKTFKHGVERGEEEGAGTGGRVGDGGMVQSGVGPTFPPLDSTVFVVHTASQPDTPHTGHDVTAGSHEGHDLTAGSHVGQNCPPQLPACEQTMADSECQAGLSKTGETMEIEEVKHVASENLSEPKRSKMDSDSAATQSPVPPPTVNTLFHLRCSLLENLPHLRRHMKAKARKAIFTSGIVYSKCPITPCELAASHEVLVLAETEEDCGKEELRNQLSAALKVVMGQDTAARLSSTSMAKSVSVGETGSLKVDAALTLKDSCATFGHIFTFEDGDPGQESGTTCRQTWGAVLYLDTILLHALRLPDVRLLWSEDRRFLGQFTAAKGDSPLYSFSTFKPLSLYPVRFVHDLSFWENPQRVFEEAEFWDVVREVAEDTVTQVSLVDRFDQADSGKTSRCYRLVFQSHDHALSYITSWRLQSVLRLKVAQRIGVTLR